MITFNPKFIGNNSKLSSDNLEVSIEGYYDNACLSTAYRKHGRYYCEFEVLEPGAADEFLFGVCTDDINIRERPYSNYTCFGYYSLGRLYADGSYYNYGQNYTHGDIVGVYLDIEGSKLEFTVNGVSQGIAPTTLPKGKNFYMLCAYGSRHTNAAARVNFGAKPFKYPVKKGYAPFDMSRGVVTKYIIKNNDNYYTIENCKLKPLENYTNSSSFYKENGFDCTSMITEDILNELPSKNVRNAKILMWTDNKEYKNQKMFCSISKEKAKSVLETLDKNKVLKITKYIEK